MKDFVFELCDRIRETSYAIHEYHGSGHLEKVYENALAHRLRKAGIGVEQQHPVEVRDEDGTAIGEYKADLLVEGQLIVELKATKTVVDENVAQLLGYLHGSKIEHGLLVNFGAQKFYIKKYAMLKNPPKSGSKFGIAGMVLSALFLFVSFCVFCG